MRIIVQYQAIVELLKMAKFSDNNNLHFAILLMKSSQYSSIAC